MILAHPPRFIKKIYPSLIWRIKTERKEIYISFDDGPTPGVTEIVLDTLKKYQAKATFFCVGKNMKKHPELLQRILKEGHAVGNHTYNHLNGWGTPTFKFVQDVKQVDSIYKSSIFRPPYGRLKSSQIKLLKRTHRIVMWSILTMDYHPKINEAVCSKIATSRWKKGSIIVFHDSLKAKKKMLTALRDVLEKCKQQNWNTAIINQ